MTVVGGCSSLHLGSRWWPGVCRCGAVCSQPDAFGAGQGCRRRSKADISKLQPGEMMTVEWRGKPVWILRRTEEMLAAIKKVDGEVSDPNSDRPMQPEYAHNEYRSIKPGIWSRSGSAPTWAARRRASSKRVRRAASALTGQEASCAPATVRPSTLPVASPKASRRPTASKCRRTCICRMPRLSSVRTGRPKP